MSKKTFTLVSAIVGGVSTIASAIVTGTDAEDATPLGWQ